MLLIDSSRGLTALFIKKNVYEYNTIRDSITYYEFYCLQISEVFETACMEATHESEQSQRQARQWCPETGQKRRGVAGDHRGTGSTSTGPDSGEEGEEFGRVFGYL